MKRLHIKEAQSGAIRAVGGMCKALSTKPCTINMKKAIKKVISMGSRLNPPSLITNKQIIKNIKAAGAPFSVAINRN